MANLQTTGPTTGGSGTPKVRKPLIPRFRFWGMLYLIMLPTLGSMAVFGYYPKFDVVVKSLFRWVPEQVEEFIGFQNYIDVFQDPLFWQSFQLVGILLVANLIKMWPAIFAAIALHRMMSDRWRYIYQVLFVVPMVIPGLVWLLIWKGFYDPDFGIVNRFLNATGLMQVLHLLDGTAHSPGVMPRLAGVMNGLMEVAVNPVFASVWGLLLVAAVVLNLHYSQEEKPARLQLYGIMLGASLLPVIGGIGGIGSTGVGALFLIVVGCGAFILLMRRIGGSFISWAIWFLAGLLVFKGHYIFFPCLLLAAFAFNEFLQARYDRFVAGDIVRWTGLAMLTAGSVLVLFGEIWSEPTGQFLEGTPAWLGNKDLVIPAILFWGFPWVGTIGVLIYLAGLQQISQDVYEAAELDGVGPIGMMFKIELPLIMTQVRINLIFMTIGTLTQYEFFLLLLGSDGGPGNRGMVPGLYMFKKAFEDGFFGYACALGMVLFVMILLLTIVYNKYVKVEK
jgi:ABC-type sugar transport system permease subunit